jgi:hypothetical protein
MRHFITDSDHWSVQEDGGECCVDRVRQAVEAFADAGCERTMIQHKTGCDGERHCSEEHAACRAALLKEIFGE